MHCKHLLAGVLCLAAVLMCPVSSWAQEEIVVEYDGMAVDTFLGVEANYITGTHNSNTGDYCCAGYVIKLYKELFDVNVYNCNTVWGKPTVVSEGHTVELIEVDTPVPGDMMQSLTYSHVGVVKDVTEDTAILIEQNYKYAKDGHTVAVYEREIGFDEAHFYRLVIDGVQITAENALTYNDESEEMTIEYSEQ